MKRIIRNKYALLVTTYALLLLVGIWYGFPNLKIVADEAPFVGGVMRALEARTLLPQIDYSYTVSFYANYLLMLPFLIGLWIIQGGDVAAVVQLLLENVYIAYFIPRLVSVMAATGLLLLFLKMLQKRGSGSFLDHVAITTIVFGNILFFTLAHTGKMWLLSLLLWFLSFYFFDQALVQENLEPRNKTWGSPWFWTPIFAFLAMANFPINLIALIFVVWLWIHVWHKKMPYWALGWGTFAGLGVFAVLFLLNHEGWRIQNSITPTAGHDWLGLLVYFGYGAVILMPLHWIYLLFCTKWKFSKSLVALLLSLGAYMALIAWRASWVGNLSDSYWRYFIYIIFIAGLIMGQLEPRRRFISIVLACFALVFMLRVGYLLAIPATYNQTREYLIDESEDQLVVNTYAYLDLPKNQFSYQITEDVLCQSRCLYGRQASSSPKSILVIDPETEKAQFKKMLSETPNYLLVSLERGGNPVVTRFENGLANYKFKDVDHGLGPYTPALFKVRRLGPSFYITKF